LNPGALILSKTAAFDLAATIEYSRSKKALNRNPFGSRHYQREGIDARPPGGTAGVDVERTSRLAVTDIAVGGLRGQLLLTLRAAQRPFEPGGRLYPLLKS
jgi:hypothetical protein